MSEYNFYGCFLVRVIDEIISQSPNFFDNILVCEDIKRVLKTGWNSFIYTCSFISNPIMTENMFASFFKTLLGQTIFHNGVDSAVFKSLNENSKTVLLIKEYGLQYKRLYDSHMGEHMYIEEMIKTVADDIIRQGELL